MELVLIEFVKNMIMEIKNKIQNIKVSINFNDMPVIPILKRTPRPLSERTGILDKWYSFKFEWMFLKVCTEWKYFR